MIGPSGFGQAPRQERSAFGSAPIRCGKTKCKWRGFETDLSNKPALNAGVSVTQNVCPTCGCDSYMFMTEKEITAWERVKRANQICTELPADRGNSQF